MLFPRVFLSALSVLIVVFVDANTLPENSTSVAPSPDLFPISAVGNIAAVQLSATADTRIFFQDSTGAIMEGGVTAGKDLGTSVLVPANQVLPFTPIFAINDPTATSYLIRLYFFSPENTLSEYIYPTTIPQNTNGFMGGPSCTACLTTQGIVGRSGSQVLYALANPAFTQFRVGFISAGQPTTVSEAVNTGAGWQVSTIPN
ncbi:hypothetical protein B0H16DRAFT_1695337 [Mycena metata]|uniref:Uncharacterized protein n=1 Tax=Mycena metata TaxID=1033252 RepID=A0AAD7MYS3_9AGAR|nr:hypothetical protein B0H16DRAFT_1695337 [Mycena metata]